MPDFLIIRLSSLGDIIHTLPAFSALRKSYPQANITWLVEAKGREILEHVPGIDRIVEVGFKQNRPGVKKFRAEKNRLKNELRTFGLTALDFQGLIKSGYLALLSGAKKRIGFHKKNLKEPLARIFYTTHLEEISEDQHVIFKNMKLLEQIDIQAQELNFPLQLSQELLSGMREKLVDIGIKSSQKLVVANIGAAWETKRWYPEKWSQVLEGIRADNIFPVLLWGNKTEKDLAQEISAAAKVPLTPELSLSEVLALLHDSALVISGDTFALQAACAFKRPVVGIFGPTNPRRNGPFAPEDHVVFQELDCSYCYKRKCSDIKCLDVITVDDVVNKCQLALGNNG